MDMSDSLALATGHPTNLATGQPLAKPGHTSGRGWAYLGAILGGAVSIAANVAHSYVPPDNALASWTPHTGAVVGAIFWPVALFVAIEILARTAWPTATRWAVLRFGGLVPVASVAAFVSYKHLSGLLSFYGEDGLTATFGPLAVDGLMVVATGALLATGRRLGQTTPVANELATPSVGQLEAKLADLANRMDMLADGQDVERIVAKLADLEPWPTKLDTGQGYGRGKWASLAGHDDEDIDVAIVDTKANAPVSPATGPVTAEAEKILRLANLASAEDMANRPDRLRRSAGSGQGRPPAHELELLVANAASQGMAKGEINELVADTYGVSIRTARRWREDLEKGLY